MISIIIPARNEIFLQRTIQDLIEHAEGEIEIIAILDGYWPNPQLEDHKQLRLVHRGKSRGMRDAINSGVAIARGEYILKLDAHCMVDQGFDIKLLADCEDDWVVIPRRKRLDATLWQIKDVGKPDVDYEYITNPKTDDMHGAVWTERAIERKDILIDENPTFQGSCWFMKKEYFNFLELMDEKTYGSFYNEAQEISLKVWLSGGKVMTNKKTWYAHLHKGKEFGRGYPLGGNERSTARDAVMQWAKHDKVWSRQIYSFEYLKTLFPNMPTWNK